MPVENLKKNTLLYWLLLNNGSSFQLRKHLRIKKAEEKFTMSPITIWDNWQVVIVTEIHLGILNPSTCLKKLNFKLSILRYKMCN